MYDSLYMKWCRVYFQVIDISPYDLELTHKQKIYIEIKDKNTVTITKETIDNYIWHLHLYNMTNTLSEQIIFY